MDRSPAYDWSTFDVHMRVPAPAGLVFDAWATSAGMESFFARQFSFARPDGVPRAPGERAAAGDAYAMMFHHPSELRGRVLDVDSGRRLALSFGDMRVDVAVSEGNGTTLVHLVQSGIPVDARGRAESHLNCRSCWVYYLLNLRSVLAHGHDLRDSDLPDNPVSIHFGAKARSTS